MTGAAPEQAEGALRVSTLELFFDLVFVFTITQLTAAVAGELTWLGLARMLVMLGVIRFLPWILRPSGRRGRNPCGAGQGKPIRRPGG